MPFTHYVPFGPIPSGQVTGTLTDYVVHLSHTVAQLKSVANGGLVPNADTNGYGLRPYSDSGLTAALNFVLLRYDPTTGYIHMKVYPGNTQVGTTIYLGLGDTSLTTDASNRAGTFGNNGFSIALPFGSSSSLDLTDYSGNGLDLTNNNSVAAGTGSLDGGAVLVAASSKSLTRASSTTLQPTSAISVGASVKFTTTGSMMIVAKVSGADQRDYDLDIDSGKFRFYFTNGGSYLGFSGSTTPNTTGYYRVWATYDGANQRLYVNGISDGFRPETAAPDASGGDFAIGKRGSASDTYLDGLVDEVYFLRAKTLSPDFIAADYNNISAPNTFIPAGTAVAVGAGGSSLVSSAQPRVFFGLRSGTRRRRGRRL